jgi:hypothetical protein
MKDQVANSSVMWMCVKEYDVRIVKEESEFCEG